MSLIGSAKSVDAIPKHLFTVLYGPPGVGKTILATRTANKTLLITAEKAYVSLSNFPEIAKTVSVLPYINYDNLNGIVRELYQGGHDYDHLMLDTLDSIISVKIKEQLKKVGFNRYHPEIPSREDFNLLANHMSDLFSRLTMLPISVTAITHDRIPDSEAYAKGDRLLRPNIPFRVFERLNGYANVVGYMTIARKNDREVRAVSVRANTEHVAKNHLRMEKTLVNDDTFVETIRNWKGI